MFFNSMNINKICKRLEDKNSRNRHKVKLIFKQQCDISKIDIKIHKI